MVILRTIDGMRIEIAVRRSLTLRLPSERGALLLAHDLSLLDCEVSCEGCVIHVTGTHAALEQVETLLTTTPVDSR